MRKVMVLSDDDRLVELLRVAAQSLGWQMLRGSAQADVLAYLVQQQPSLTVLDTAITSLDWRHWALLGKSSPATRKQPIVALVADAHGPPFQHARNTGCDAVLTQAAFEADVVGVLTAWARRDDEAELLRQSALPLPELAKQGVAHFNAGEYYEQHELFEHAWRAEPGPVRQLYQAILQVGVAYYQIQRKNYVGARKMFMRAWQYLNVLPDMCQGVNVAQLRHDAKTAQTALESLGPDRIAEFDMRLLKGVMNDE
ncbi:MAG: DUF309 domain-containing protein [Anaerolineae bacterium]|nr:DUF309 domain-containing protein [Anaerolineae bacterium]